MTPYMISLVDNYDTKCTCICVKEEISTHYYRQLS